MSQSFDYDIELDELRLAEDKLSRDNTIALQQALLKIQEILNDLNTRLDNGGL